MQCVLLEGASMCTSQSLFSSQQLLHLEPWLVLEPARFPLAAAAGEDLCPDGWLETGRWLQGLGLPPSGPSLESLSVQLGLLDPQCSPRKDGGLRLG